MTRKEDVDVVVRMVNDARETEARRVERERITREREEAERVRKEKETKLEAETKLRKTGIVDLFVAIRDRGVVKLSDKPQYKYRQGLFSIKQIKVSDYVPAEVRLSGSYLSIRFNQGQCYVEAYFEGDSLIVKGKDKMVVDKDLGMVEAVGKAIIDPVVYESDNSGDVP